MATAAHLHEEHVEHLDIRRARPEGARDDAAMVLDGGSHVHRVLEVERAPAHRLREHRRANFA